MKQIIASVLVALPILLNAQQACEPTADLDQDGVVGISDLLNLLSAFGDTDLDFDSIYDSVDDCVGAFDEFLRGNRLTIKLFKVICTN